MRGKAAGERKRTPEQHRAKEAFDAWWIQHGFPEAHDGVEYPAYDGADAAAVWKVLSSKEIAWDVGRAQELARFYLKQPEVYSYTGHRLRELGNRMGTLLTQLARSKKGHHGNGKHHKSAAARGEYSSDLPVGRQLLDEPADEVRS